MISYDVLPGLILLVAASLTAGGGILCTRQIVYRLSVVLGVLGSLILVISSLYAIFSDTMVCLFTYHVSQTIWLYFGIDRLSGIFILLLSLVSCAGSIYIYDEFNQDTKKIRLMVRNALMYAFLISMIFVLLAQDSIGFITFWELMAITSFFLVMYEYEKAETRKAGMYYIAMTQLSTVFIMAGFLLLFISTGTFDFIQMKMIQIESNDLAFLLLFIGFAIKAGVIPVHKWLPYAHPAAPSVISALMSGVMLNIAIYGLLRMVLFIQSPAFWWGFVILIFGLVSAILGIMYAMKESDIKVLLAYSSIENIGVILIGIGLSIILSFSSLPYMATLALVGSLFHAFSHGVIKSLLFMSAGSLVHSTGTRNLDEMGGLIHRMPKTAGIFFTGSLAISAIPPLCCFIGELMIFEALFLSFHEVAPLMRFILLIVLSILAFVSAMSAACFVKAFGIAFLGLPRTKGTTISHEVSISALLGPGMLAIIGIVFGVFSYQILSLLGYPDLIPDMSGISLVLFLSIGCVYLLTRLSKNTPDRVTDTWDCGIRTPAARIEYTSVGFSEPLLTIFSALFRTKKCITKQYQDPDHCIFQGGTAEMRLFRFFEEYLYIPVSKMIYRTAEIISRHQNGSLDTYLMYLFITVVIIILMMGCIA